MFGLKPVLFCFYQKYAKKPYGKHENSNDIHIESQIRDYL